MLVLDKKGCQSSLFPSFVVNSLAVTLPFFSQNHPCILSFHIVMYLPTNSPFSCFLLKLCLCPEISGSPSAFIYFSLQYSTIRLQSKDNCLLIIAKTHSAAVSCYRTHPTCQKFSFLLNEHMFFRT